MRVAIPGAEVLFAFLLGVAFTERFHQSNELQRTIYFGVLLTTAAATALLIAPTAYHRVRFREADKERMLFSATRMAITSLVLLTLSISGVVFLVGDVLFSSPVRRRIGTAYTDRKPAASADQGGCRHPGAEGDEPGGERVASGAPFLPAP